MHRRRRRVIERSERASPSAVAASAPADQPDAGPKMQRFHRSAPARRRGVRQRLLPWAVTAIVGTPYLVLLWSPLRLAGDEIAYLSIAASIADGVPVPSGSIHYPRGYPLMLAAFDRAGLGIPWVFVALNLAFLAVGLAAAYVVLRRDFRFGALLATLVCCLVLLSRTVSSTASAAVTDVPFFGVAMMTLALLPRVRIGEARAAWLRIGGACVLAGCAVTMRTIGIALLPTIAFAVARQSVRGEILLRRLRTPAGAVAGALAAAAIGAAAFILAQRAGYLHAASSGWDTARGVRGIAAALLPHIRDELAQVGELAANVSRRRIPGPVESLYPLLGAVAMAAVLVGAWSRRRAFAVPDVFALAAGAVVFVWPGYDARLLLPTLPLLLGYALLALAHAPFRRTAALVATAAVAVFVASGIATMVYTDRLALARSNFPEEWGKTVPRYEATYRLAFRPGSRVATGDVDAAVLRLLRRYEPRASLSRGGADPRRGAGAAGRSDGATQRLLDDLWRSPQSSTTSTATTTAPNPSSGQRPPTRFSPKPPNNNSLQKRCTSVPAAQPSRAASRSCLPSRGAGPPPPDT